MTLFITIFESADKPNTLEYIFDSSNISCCLSQLKMAFRFLDLPPELRNRVYTFVYLDNSTRSMDIFNAYEHVPKVALTRVSKQLRNETFGMYHEATAQFWSNHELSMSIDCASTSKRRREDDIHHQLIRLHNESGTEMIVKSLTFNVKPRTVRSLIGRDLGNASVLVEINTDLPPSNVAWHCVFDNDMSGMGDAMADVLEEWCDKNPGVMLEMREKKGEGEVLSLVASKCVRAVICAW